ADSGSSWTLPRLVGWAKAKELLLLPRTIKAEEALELALATRVVAADEVLPVAQELAATMAAGPTVAYASIRQALAFSAAHDLAASRAKEGERRRRTGTTEAPRNAVAAFNRKEPPIFHGR